jgi:hypothetical protein
MKNPITLVYLIAEDENPLQWWGRWDSNPRPPAPQADILPS